MVASVVDGSHETIMYVVGICGHALLQWKGVAKMCGNGVGCELGYVPAGMAVSSVVMAASLKALATTTAGASGGGGEGSGGLGGPIHPPVL